MWDWLDSSACVSRKKNNNNIAAWGESASLGVGMSCYKCGQQGGKITLLTHLKLTAAELVRMASGLICVAIGMQNLTKLSAPCTGLCWNVFVDLKVHLNKNCQLQDVNLLGLFAYLSLIRCFLFFLFLFFPFPSPFWILSFCSSHPENSFSPEGGDFCHADSHSSALPLCWDPSSIGWPWKGWVTPGLLAIPESLLWLTHLMWSELDQRHQFPLSSDS